jgi:hypothetical protein
MTGTTNTVNTHDAFFIDGRWVSPSSDTMVEVIDASTEETSVAAVDDQAVEGDHIRHRRVARGNSPETRRQHRS